MNEDVPMDEQSVDAQARRYLRFHEVEFDLADKEADRAATQIDVRATMGRPEEAWPVIVAAIEMTDDEGTLAGLGAGDLENIIRNHGPEFIDRIEQLARTSWRFRRALRAVWADTPVRARIDQALNHA
jgi:hypothetical protein